MKIGYYIPCLNDLPVSGKNYRAFNRRHWGLQPIKWESEYGLEFIESLFTEGNLSLPIYNPNAKTFYKPSFKSLQDFLLVLKLSRTIEQSENLAISIHERNYPYPEGTNALVGKLLDLKKEISNPENNQLKDESFQTKLETNIKNFDQQEKILRELSKNLEEKVLALNGGDDEYLRHGLSNFWKALDDPFWDYNSKNQDILVRGFKLSEQIYEPAKLFSDLGYSNDALENNMKSLKEFNSKHRNNSNKILNKFYKVVRTNDPKDILYLSKERSTSNQEKVVLVFKSHEILKKDSYSVDEHIRGSDNVYFRKFHTNPKTGVISLIVSDGRKSGFAEEDKELNYGILRIFDPKTKKGLKADHPIIRHFENVLRNNHVLEGYKLGNMFAIDLTTGKNTKFRWVETGVMGKPCSACDLVPCDCQTILDWENYIDPRINAQAYWGFSKESELEFGKSPKDIDTSGDPGHGSADDWRNHNQLGFFNEQTYPQGRDEHGLDWSRYNDQLDMDQQDPEFWC
jgi:hypothetical protein